MKLLFVHIFLVLFICLLSAQTGQMQQAMQGYRYREAIQLLESASENVGNRLLKAECYQKLYDYSAALDIYDILTADDQVNVEILTAAADCASQAGDYDASLRYWLKASELSPDNLYLQTRKVVAYYRTGDWLGTIRASEECLQAGLHSHAAAYDGRCPHPNE